MLSTYGMSKKYIFYHMILPSSIASSSFLITVSTKIHFKNQYKVSKFEINKNIKINLRCFKYLHIKILNNNKLETKTSLT